MDNVVPVLDNAVLQAKANEYAMAGAIESIKEFYTGWQSPYRKAINEKLQLIEIGHGIDLPDIIGLINTSLSKEIEGIANEAVSKSFLPLVKNLLTRAPKEIKFSDLLAEFIEINYKITYDNSSLSIEDSKHGWLEVQLMVEDRQYNLTLHKVSEISSNKDKEGEPVKYQFLSLPWNEEKYAKTMKMEVEGGVILHLPFTSDVLKDRFVSYIANLIISKTEISMDCRSFSEDMFPEKCHCD